LFDEESHSRKAKTQPLAGFSKYGARTRTTGACAGLNNALALARRVRPLAE